MLKEIIEDCELLQVGGDLGCFFKKRILIGAHVDDLLAIESKEELYQINKEIKQYVEQDIRGISTKILGMQITWDDNGVSITQ